VAKKQSYPGIVDENVLHSSVRKRTQPPQPSKRKAAAKKAKPPVKDGGAAAKPAKATEPPTWERRDARTREEPKSRRLQLVMRPSLYSEIKAYADKVGYSVNEVMNGIAENFIKTV
jgi:hypothetical protein